MTFKELQDAALGSSFNPTTKRANAGRYINRAYMRVARAIGMASTEAKATATTTIGIDTYALPSDFQRFHGENPVWLNNNPLEQIDRNEIEDRGPASGTPVSFAHYDENIVLWPSPATAVDLTMFYRAGPVSMAADDDEPIIPEQHHELLVLYARGRLYGDEDDDQAMANWLGQFEGELRELRQQEGRNSAFRRQVPSMWRGASTVPSFRRP